MNTMSNHARPAPINTRAEHAHRRMRPGTAVVSTADGESGTVVRICTYRRNGIDAWSYLVDTAYGREIWHRGELFAPASDQA